MVLASLAGRTLGGKYRIVRLLGQGGMATVYLGYQETLERQVAIKVLPPHPGLNAMFVERFQLEAKTVARLQHPHILPLYDHGVEDDILYLVTPYIDGGALDEVMRDGRVDTAYTERLLRQLAGALDYAHRQGVIHRDIKPGNILLDGEGNALLADFGIAKIAGDTGNLTGTGVVGTPAYMSPEQCQGMALDARADIYSLGVVVYEMLTGIQPYQAETPINVMMKHVTEPPPDILAVAPHLPEGLRPVMLRVLAKDPADRYQTTAEFAADLSAVLSGRPPSTSVAPAARRADNTPPSSPTVPIPPMTGSAADPDGQPAPIPQPTIIVQQDSSTRLLVIGFGVIALLVIAGFGLLLLAATRPADTDAGGAATTAPAQVAQDAAPTRTPRPTTEPVAASNLRGRAVFGQSRQPGDSVNVRLRSVPLPGQGRVYVVWLGSTLDERALNIGRIAIDATGEGGLSYIDPDGAFLPALYDRVRVTAENLSDEGAATPRGALVYEGTLLPAVSTLMSELFVASKAGFGGRGLLDSAIREARFAQQHAGLASGARNAVGMRLHAEHTLQILNGGNTDYDGDGRVSNPGTGIGLYTFLDTIEDLLLALADEDGVEESALGESDNMRVCLDNVRRWADAIVALELEIVVAETMDAVRPQLAESTRLADILVDGVDANENGLIEIFEGECGLLQSGAAALLIASINLTTVAAE